MSEGITEVCTTVQATPEELSALDAAIQHFENDAIRWDQNRGVLSQGIGDGLRESAATMRGLFSRLNSTRFDRLPLATPEQVKDTERLDWLERDHNAVVHPVFRGTGDDAAFGVAVKHEEGSGFSPNGKLREAIDAARAARPEGQG